MVFEKIVPKSQVVTKFDVTKSRLHCIILTIKSIEDTNSLSDCLTPIFNVFIS